MEKGKKKNKRVHEETCYVGNIGFFATFATSGYMNEIETGKGKNKRVHENFVSKAPTGYIGHIGLAPFATSGYMKCTGPNKKTRKLEWGSSKSKSLQKTKITHGPQSHERTSKIKKEDKKSGSYERCTTKEKVSCGKRHVERCSGKIGLKNEVKKSSTVKVGNKTGYTEYYTEERVRKVDFGSSSNNNFICDGNYYYDDDDY